MTFIQDVVHAFFLGKLRCSSSVLTSLRVANGVCAIDSATQLMHRELLDEFLLFSHNHLLRRLHSLVHMLLKLSDIRILRVGLFRLFVLDI